MIGAKVTERETTERTVNRVQEVSGKKGKGEDQVRNSSSKLASIDQSTGPKFVSVVIFEVSSAC